MKFLDFPYQRPDFEQATTELKTLVKQFEEAKNGQEQIEIIEKYFEISDEFSSNVTIASIRNAINTKDQFYETEMKFYDENNPILSSFIHKFQKVIVESPFKADLIAKFGKHYFNLIEVSLKTFDEKIIPLLIEENKLAREYDNLIAAAQIEFEGKIYNLSQMGPFLESIDRKTRHQAQLKMSEYFQANEEKLDQIYDSLVKTRHQMAQTLGFKNYIELGYYRMGRTEYDANDVANYREQIKKEVVPAVTKFNQRKAKRLKIEKLKSYDRISFLSGNPKPKGTKADLVNAAKLMYSEMSAETKEFFEYMLKHELFDLESKAGKRGGGFCTYIPKYEAPFIFANFNGTLGDVDVLTHEAGHAFQVYSSRNNYPSQRWPGMDAAEIHSMSMEFFAWPWMEAFFKEDSKKYYFTHLVGAISFLPYGATVDEFQHRVYENPELTPEARKEIWRSLEKIYSPEIDDDDDDFLKKGTYWYRQSHIFGAPFYYIDYTLAQVCAFQYWVKDRLDHEKAWKSYYHLSTLGGTQGFVGLLKEAGLDSPFEPGTIKKVLKPLLEYLDTIDDLNL